MRAVLEPRDPSAVLGWRGGTKVGAEAVVGRNSRAHSDGIDPILMVIEQSSISILIKILNCSEIVTHAGIKLADEYYGRD